MNVLKYNLRAWKDIGMRLITRITDSDFYGGEPIYLPKISRSAARGVVFDEHNQIAMMFLAEVDLYKLPGGGIEEGESAEQAFLREIMEETGCEAEIIEHLGYIEEHKSRNDYMQYSFCFLANVKLKLDQVYLTEKEKKLGMQVEWMNKEKSMDIMNRLVQESTDYGERFMLLRDRTILEAAITRLESDDRRS